MYTFIQDGGLSKYEFDRIIKLLNEITVSNDDMNQERMVAKMEGRFDVLERVLTEMIESVQ